MTKDFLRSTVPTADCFVSSGCIDSIRSRIIQFVVLNVKRMTGYQVSTISTLLYIQQHVNQWTDLINPFFLSLVGLF